MRRALLLTSLLVVGGCVEYGTYWGRPGASDADFDRAATNCEHAAFARFPPMTMGRPGFFRTPTEYCAPTAGGTNCAIIGGGYLPQARSAADTNTVPRENDFRACMLAGGWRPLNTAGGAVWSVAPPTGAVSEAAVGEAVTYCEAIFNRKPNATQAAVFHNRFDQCVMTRARELSGPRPPA